MRRSKPLDNFYSLFVIIKDQFLVFSFHRTLYHVAENEYHILVLKLSGKNLTSLEFSSTDYNE